VPGCAKRNVVLVGALTRGSLRCSPLLKMSVTSTVLYHLQGEPGESEVEPNCTQFKTSTAPCLRDFKQVLS